MDVFYDLKPGLIKESALALGFFDGVHPGHQVVIKKALQEARALGVTPAVVTFKDHPRTLTTGSAPKLLTLVEQRLELFDELGIEATLVLTFREEICRMSPREYVETVLVGALGARSLSMGINHRFGRNREGNPQLLATLGKEFGFSVHTAPMIDVGGAEVSSSRIRELIVQGDIQLSNKLLSRPYAILGKVIKGDGRGRTIGVPTANLQVSSVQVLPKPGVYAGFYRLSADVKIPAVINIGFRPTVYDNSKLSVEAHILNFNQDLYDQIISIEFCHHLRDEKKFPSLDELKTQIASDCQVALDLLSTTEANASQTSSSK